jgi:hypothetical protein
MKTNKNHIPNGVMVGIIIAVTMVGFGFKLFAPSRSPDEPIKVLKDFLKALSLSEYESAYTYIAPSSKISGDPVVYNTPLDYNSFVNEIAGTYKYLDYALGDYRWESDEHFYIWITFGSGDKDEALLVLEDGQWYVADPIHIIR